jgi:hypothetical protein
MYTVSAANPFPRDLGNPLSTCPHVPESRHAEARFGGRLHRDYKSSTDGLIDHKSSTAGQPDRRARRKVGAYKGDRSITQVGALDPRSCVLCSKQIENKGLKV